MLLCQFSCLCAFGYLAVVFGRLHAPAVLVEPAAEAEVGCLYGAHPIGSPPGRGRG